MNSLAQLIADFRDEQGCCRRGEMKAFQDLEIEVAIRKAALARDEKGEIYSHQWHLKEKYPDVPKKAERILANCAGKIAACNDFDALHDLIWDELKLRGRVKGVGELYC